MSIFHLDVPILKEDIEDIRIGDLIYLTGTLVTARDDVHLRVVKQADLLPLSLINGAIFHAGPIMKETEIENHYEVISIGPTTSMRMERYEKEFLEQTGVRLVIGKGGMGTRTADACRALSCLHAVFPGGCAVLAASQVEEVEAVHWLELGMPEALWVMRVKEFGPLLVSIDRKGNNLFEEQKELYEQRKGIALEEINAYIEADYKI